MKGIDVSQHQGRIDWARVRADGIEFALIRAGFGMYPSQVDRFFKENMEGAKAAGIPVGVYWYSYALTPDEGRREAEVCLDVIREYGRQIVLPVWYDMEPNQYRAEHGFLYDRTHITGICESFLNAVWAAGYRAGVYASKSWLESYIDVQRLECPVWVAQWASQSEYAGDKLIWQYSSRGTVSGIRGYVDLDQGYDGLLPLEEGWKLEGGRWYYYRNQQPLRKQWLKDGEWWYYLSATGAMLTGAQNINGKVYYLNPQRAEGIPTGACVITDPSGAVAFP